MHLLTNLVIDTWDASFSERLNHWKIKTFKQAKPFDS
jgi:hypothetical protein